MHYYQHHIGDFIKDTSFLTNEEIGIYMKLIWLYYDTEQPLPNDLFVLSMKTNARGNEDAVQGILGMYFQLVDNKWHHSRCDKEIAEYTEYCAKQKANGLKGGRPKATQDKPKQNPPVSQDEPKITLTTNHKPLTTNHIKTTPIGFDLFWDAYDKKVGKPNSIKAWAKVDFDRFSLQAVVEAAKRDRKAKPDNKYRKDPERWLKGQHWLDEVVIEQAPEQKLLPLGTNEQIEYAYRTECGGDPSRARFGSYQEMRKFVQDFRDKKLRNGQI